MQLFTLSTILLLAATSSLMTAAVSAKRATTCQGNSNVQHLRCDKGVIRVQTSFYGRVDRTTCSQGKPAKQLANISCRSKGTLDFVRKRCNGKKECEVHMADVHNPNPCYGTYKYLDTKYTCLPATRVVACEHSLAHLSCKKGKVISVFGADYGRRDGTTCAYKRGSDIKNTSCYGSTHKVAQKCNGKNSCTIHAENSVFGDPCSGTYKYLEVAYRCKHVKKGSKGPCINPRVVSTME